MCRFEDEKMICVDVKMGRCEEEKMTYRPPVLEEPVAQRLSRIVNIRKKLITNCLGQFRLDRTR